MVRVHKQFALLPVGLEKQYQAGALLIAHDTSRPSAGARSGEGECRSVGKACGGRQSKAFPRTLLFYLEPRYAVSATVNPRCSPFVTPSLSSTFGVEPNPSSLQICSSTASSLHGSFNSAQHASELRACPGSPMQRDTEANKPFTLHSANCDCISISQLWQQLFELSCACQ